MDGKLFQIKVGKNAPVLSEQIEKTADYYESKFGIRPTRLSLPIGMDPKEFKETMAGIVIDGFSAQPGHFILGPLADIEKKGEYDGK